MFSKLIIYYSLFIIILNDEDENRTLIISSISPSYYSNLYGEKSPSNEIIKDNSHWIKDHDFLSKLESNNPVVIIYIVILSLLIFLLLIKFLSQPELSKADKLIEDSFIRYTINDDTETDKKVLKYLIEKEIEYILKNRRDYEKQKRLNMDLDEQNDIFNTDQKVITIIEDDSDDDDDEEIDEKRVKKVSFRTPDNNKKKNENKNSRKRESSFKRMKSLKKSKNKNKKKETNIELSSVKEDNDFIEVEETLEDVKNQSNKYKYSFNYKNNSQKTQTLLSNNIAEANLRETTYSNCDIANEGDNNTNTTHMMKKQSMSQRFYKNVKEQKSRLIYSIVDKTISEIKNTGQNSIEASSSLIKRPRSLIGISNALNKISNKGDEKILIKNEFCVTFKIMWFILIQYEYRLIALFNRLLLPITRNNLIILLCFRLNLQLSICIILSPRYFKSEDFPFHKNNFSVIGSLIISDVIYTFVELFLMKKKISTSTDIKQKGIFIFKQIIECLLGYIIIIAFLLFGIFNSFWVSVYLEEYNVQCCYLKNFYAMILLDYIIYEPIFLNGIKAFIFTYVIYKDSEGCILNVMEKLKNIFIFYLAE